MDLATQAAPDAAVGGTFAELVTRYHALVCAVAYGATGDRALSEDVAQDTFVVAWRGRHTLRDPARMRQWLCAIARHLALNTRRDRRHEPLEDAAAVAGDVDLHARLEQHERDALVWEAIAAIPETYRVALVLYYREDKSIAEVATLLGISQANALQRLSRGRRHLERGVEDLVERSLSSSKPDRARHQAVLAAVAADLTGVSADAALEAARVSIESASWKVTIMKVAIATCAVAGAVALVQWGCAGELEKEGDSIASAPRDAALGGDPGPVDADEARKQMQRAELERAMRAGADGAASRGGASGVIPAALPTYRLSIIDADGVAVNLAGGPSALMGANEALGIDMPTKPRGKQRKVTGRVVDASGAPVHGAVVIAGAHLTMMLDTSVSARAGDETDARGHYEVTVDAANPCAVLALHREGWSTIEHLDAGTKEVSLDLELGAPARVHGVARRGEVEQDGVLLLSDAAHLVRWSYPTDDTGKFSIVVPRGAFTLGFRPGERLGSGDARVREPIDLRAGAELEWNPRVPVGTRLAVDVPMPPGDLERLTMIWVGVLPGRSAPDDAAAMRALARQREDVRLTGFGGEDLDEVFEFEDLAAGTYTVCAEAEPRQTETTPPPSLAFACRQVTLAKGEEVQELKFAW